MQSQHSQKSKTACLWSKCKSTQYHKVGFWRYSSSPPVLLGSALNKKLPHAGFPSITTLYFERSEVEGPETWRINLLLVCTCTVSCTSCFAFPPRWPRPVGRTPLYIYIVIILMLLFQPVRLGRYPRWTHPSSSNPLLLLLLILLNHHHLSSHLNNLHPLLIMFQQLPSIAMPADLGAHQLNMATLLLV